MSDTYNLSREMIGFPGLTGKLNRRAGVRKNEGKEIEELKYEGMCWGVITN